MMMGRIALLVAALASTAAAQTIPPEQPQYRDRIVMMGLMSKLRAGIQSACGCRVAGVSVLRWSSYPDTSRWRIDWESGITDEQKAAGIEFMRTFDPANNIE